MKSNSWIIVSKQSGKALFETWDARLVRCINTKFYEALTSYDYLTRLNQQIKETA